jgi:hypothetical protein
MPSLLPRMATLLQIPESKVPVQQSGSCVVGETSQPKNGSPKLAFRNGKETSNKPYAFIDVEEGKGQPSSCTTSTAKKPLLLRMSNTFCMCFDEKTKWEIFFLWLVVTSTAILLLLLLKVFLF